MSLIPERYICQNCGGYDVTGAGSVGRNLASRCKCGEREAEAKPEMRAA